MDISPAIAKKTIVWEGKPYTLTPPNLGAEAMFADYLGRNAIKEVVHMRDAYGSSYQEALQGVRREVADGFYGWGGEAWSKAMLSDRHFQELALIVLNQEHPDVSKPMVAAMWRATTGEKVPFRIAGIEQVGANGNVLLREQRLGEVIWETIMDFINRPNSPGRGTSEAPAPAAQQSAA